MAVKEKPVKFTVMKLFNKFKLVCSPSGEKYLKPQTLDNAIIIFSSSL